MGQAHDSIGGFLLLSCVGPLLSRLAEGAQSAAHKVSMWDAGMEHEVGAKIHLQQKTAKKQLLFSHYGEGAPQQMQTFHSRMVAYAGTPEIT
eukprot:6469050-Amphidinium_carterae.3